MTNTSPFTAALCALLLCFGFTECDACAICGSPGVARGEPRELTRVTVGDAEVVVSLDVVDYHAAMDFTFSGGGRGALPTGVAVSPGSHWPVQVVEVRRGDTGVELDDAHGNEYTFRVTGTLDEDAAAAAVAGAEATTCTEGERLVYRIVGPGFDSGFHGVYVQGDLALHVALSRDDAECATVLSAMPPLEERLAAQLRDGNTSACARVAQSRGPDAGFDCSLRWPGSTPPELLEQLKLGVAAGTTHQPDWEATVFACLTAADPERPGCRAYLASTSTPERRRAFLTAQAECTGADCLPFATLVTEGARLRDEALCATLFERAARFAESGPEGLRDAGIYAAELGVCTPAERHEQLARTAFLQDDGTSDDRVFSRCPTEVDRLCRSLPRLGAAYVAGSCDAASVTQARALLASTTQRVGSAQVDSALIVLARCAPEEARAWLTEHIDAPIPRSRELAHFGLAVPGP